VRHRTQAVLRGRCMARSSNEITATRSAGGFSERGRLVSLSPPVVGSDHNSGRRQAVRCGSASSLAVHSRVRLPDFDPRTLNGLSVAIRQPPHHMNHLPRCMTVFAYDHRHIRVLICTFGDGIVRPEYLRWRSPDGFGCGDAPEQAAPPAMIDMPITWRRERPSCSFMCRYSRVLKCVVTDQRLPD
jgi:hypothetical protein